MNVIRLNSISLKIMFSIILLWPPIIFLLTWLFDNKGILTISYVADLVILALVLIQQKSKRSIIMQLVAVAFLLCIGLYGNFSKNNLIFALHYYFALSILLLLSKKNYDLSNLKRVIIYNLKLFFLCQAIFFIVVATYVMKNGFYEGWGTMVLKGPFDHPHTLAYFMFFYIAADLFLLSNKKNIVWLVLFAFSFELLVLTGVRSAFLATIFLILFYMFYMIKKREKRIIVFLLCSFLVLGIVNHYFKVTDVLVDKTANALSQTEYLKERSLDYLKKSKLKTAAQTAAQTADLTFLERFYDKIVFIDALSNCRASILISSFSSLWVDAQSWSKKITCGIGLDPIMKTNLKNLYMNIHAHNDFADIVIAFGVICLIIYCLSFLTFSTGNVVITLLTLGLLAFMNGYFMYFHCTFMIIYLRMLFESANCK